MRGAFGKPQGKVARVSIGDPIISIRVADKNEKHVVEGLRRYDRLTAAHPRPCLCCQYLCHVSAQSALLCPVCISSPVCVVLQLPATAERQCHPL